MLKKTKMRKLLCELSFQMPALKECKYTYSRGCEWLRAYCEKEDIKLKMFHENGKYISIEILENPKFDENDERICTFRRCFFGNEYDALLLLLG